MRYTSTHRHKEAKDMATKKKVEQPSLEELIELDMHQEYAKAVDAAYLNSQPASDELKKILDHFGENSAEYAEAKAKAEAE